MGAEIILPSSEVVGDFLLQHQEDLDIGPEATLSQQLDAYKSDPRFPSDISGGTPSREHLVRARMSSHRPDTDCRELLREVEMYRELARLEGVPAEDIAGYRTHAPG